MHSTIARSEGIRGLYQGVTVSALGSAVSWGIYFYVYAVFKKELAALIVKEGQNPGPIVHLSAAGLSGIFVTLCTNPIWVVKTRMQVQFRGESRKYRTLTGTLATIWKEEGFKGLYAGILPGLLITTTHGAFQFMAYEELKRILQSQKSDGILNSSEVFLIGSLSKIFAAASTYPILTIRTRLQDRPIPGQPPKYKGFIDGFIKTLRNEGPKGLYRGLFPHILRTTPNSAITLVVYEKVKQLLNDNFK